MSTPGDGMDVLLNAVRDTLRSVLSLDATECDVCPEAQPPPNCGRRYVSIWGGSAQNTQVNCLDERYGFKITVTVKTGDVPYDRRRNGGAWALAFQCRAVIHMSYQAMQLAAQADPNFVVTEPPCFESAAYQGAKGPDWFWAEPTGSSADPTGIAIELSFGRARRIQYIEDLANLD